jgi:hypothetical protein
MLYATELLVQADRYEDKKLYTRIAAKLPKNIKHFIYRLIVKRSIF